ncbi:MAG TPA: dihydrofolate reductase family protein [Chryseolinea sp.]|nr:dihydrofolate reductase family protein [Chryseolinea sp.]
MRKIVLNLALSLDGLIAGPNGEYDWCFTDADYGMTEFMNSVDSTIMGGKSYRLLLDYGSPYPELTKYVVTRTERESPYPNVVFVRDNVSSFVEDLKSKNGKNIWLFGGAEITQMLLERDLVDVLMLAVHPIVLGDGIQLFGKSSSRKLFELADSIRYPSGLVQLIYNKK